MAELFSREDHDAERQMFIIGSQDTVRVCIRFIQEIKAEFWSLEDSQTMISAKKVKSEMQKL